MKIKFWMLLFISIVAVAGLESTIFFKIQADRFRHRNKVLWEEVSALEHEKGALLKELEKYEKHSRTGSLERMELDVRTFEIFNAAK